MRLALAAVTCLPVAVRIRAHLLLFPISFYATFVTLVVSTVVRTSRPAEAVAMAVLALTVGVSARASRLEQLSLHPMSAEHIFRDWRSTVGYDSRASRPTGSATSRRRSPDSESSTTRLTSSAGSVNCGSGDESA